MTSKKQQKMYNSACREDGTLIKMSTVFVNDSMGIILKFIFKNFAYTYSHIILVIGVGKRIELLNDQFIEN